MCQQWTPDVGKGWEIFLPPPPDFGRRKRKRVWLSSNDRNHWSKSSPLTKYWRHETAVIVGALDIPMLDRAWVIGAFSFGDKRRRDVHNYMPTMKAAIDGCTDAGLWVDDRDGILVGPDLRRREIPGVRGLTLHVYEVMCDGGCCEFLGG